MQTLILYIEYLASGVIVVLSNPCVCPSSRIKINFSYYRHKSMNYRLHAKQYLYQNQCLKLEKVNVIRIQYHIHNNNIY